jgi:MFS family permease
MSPSEAGILFCVSAICLFTYGLTISGFIIDKMGVKRSLMLGLSLYCAAKFFLIFADTRVQLWIVMTTLAPLGISIIFPALVLGVKKLTFENARPCAYSLFFGFMVVGAILGGPIVDWIRHDYKYTTWHYTHHNPETDRDEDRIQEFSAWRTITFVGFCLNICLLILLCFYKTIKEEPFKETNVDWDEIDKLTFCQIFMDLFNDKRFWRFMLFSLVIVGPKLVFALLFFMLPRIIMQDYGEDAPFGIYISVAPILILLFLWLL